MKYFMHHFIAVAASRKLNGDKRARVRETNKKRTGKTVVKCKHKSKLEHKHAQTHTHAHRHRIFNYMPKWKYGNDEKFCYVVVFVLLCS